MPTGLEALAAAYAPRERQRRHAQDLGPLNPFPEPVESAVATTDELLPKNQSAFMSALNWIGRPGQVVKNVATGNLEGALRQGADFIGDAVDAVVPGDVIDELSRPQDYVEGSALLGLSDAWRKEHPLLNVAASLPVDVLTDPLTITGFAPLAKAAGAIGNVAATGIKALPKGAEALAALGKGAQAAGDLTRSVFGAERVAKPYADLITKGEEVGAGVTTAEQKAFEAAARASGLDDEAATLVSMAIQDIKPAAAETGKRFEPILGQAGMPSAAPVAGAETVAERSGEALTNVREAVPANYKPDPLSQLLGAVPEATVASRGTELAKPLEVAGMQQGGAIPDLAYTGLKDVPQSEKWLTVEQRQQAWLRALEQLPGSPEAKAKAAAFLQQYAPLQQQQLKTAVETGQMARPIGQDLERLAPSYLQRQFSGLMDENVAKALGDVSLKGAPKAITERSIPTSEALADTLNTRPNLELNLDARVAGLTRAQQSGHLAKAATVSRGLVDEALTSAQAKNAKYAKELSPYVDRSTAVMDEAGTIYKTADEAKAAGVVAPKPLYTPAEQAALKVQDFALVDEEFKAATRERLKEIAASDPVTAKALSTAITGLEGRGPFLSALAKGNQLFKKAAVYGAFIPKLGSLTRNITAGIWNTLAEKEARSALSLETIKDALANFGRSVDDGVESLFGRRIGTTNDLAEVEKAFAASGGDPAKAFAAIQNPTMREAAQVGIFSDGFVNAEEMARDIARSGWRKNFVNFMDMPGVMFKGTEQRMRYGLFKALRKQGRSIDEAARITKQTFYDYSTNSVANRTARDFIPFFQFTAKAIPQQARFLKEKPAVAVGLASLLGEKQGQAVYPYMEGRVNIPLGTDEEGNPTFASGLGLPVESLNMIPNPSGNPLEFGRQIGRNVIGASTPPLKTALSAAFGTDPYFGTQFGSYDKLPGNVNGGAAGRAYNILAGAGLIQPLAEPLRMIGKVADDRQTAGQKTLDLLTGANVVSVDQDKALQQRLTNYLKQHPDIASVESLYSKSKDPQAQALIKELQAAKQRLKKKRAASAR